jgi:hypothetical protein
MDLLNPGDVVALVVSQLVRSLEVDHCANYRKAPFRRSCGYNLAFQSGLLFILSIAYGHIGAILRPCIYMHSQRIEKKHEWARTYHARKSTVNAF